MTRFFLCNKQDIPNHQACGFSINTAQGSIELFALRQGDNISVFKNHCPHLGIPLNWQADQFMSLESTYIQCSTHGALFTLEDGECIAGPCTGQKLTPLTLEQRNDDQLWLQLDPM